LTCEFPCGCSSCAIHDGGPCWMAGEEATSGRDANAVSVVVDPSTCGASSGAGASLSWIGFASVGEGAASGANPNAISVVAATCGAAPEIEGSSLSWMDFAAAGEDAAASVILGSSRCSVLAGGGVLPCRAESGSRRSMDLALSNDVSFGFNDNNGACGKRGAASPDLTGTGVAAAAS
jgi:hypothetical protein